MNEDEICAQVSLFTWNGASSERRFRKTNLGRLWGIVDMKLAREEMTFSCEPIKKLEMLVVDLQEMVALACRLLEDFSQRNSSNGYTLLSLIRSWLSQLFYSKTKFLSNEINYQNCRILESCLAALKVCGAPLQLLNFLLETFKQLKNYEVIYEWSGSLWITRPLGGFLRVQQ